MTDDKPKVVFAPSDQVEDLEHWVDVVLAAIGHPEALVSDESCFSDFQPFSVTRAEIEDWHVDIQAKLGLEFPRRGTLIIDLARQAKAAQAN
jgi:hypothetical protein